jgi:hypothetical protein
MSIDDLIETKRKSFSKKELVEQEEWVLKWMYVGLRESGITGKLIRALSNKEIAAYSLGVYLKKHKMGGLVAGENESLYQIVSRYIGMGMGMVNKRGIEQNDQLYKGVSLQERLETIPEENIKRIKQELNEEPKEYVTEGAYPHVKRERGTNYNLEVMDFLPVYIKDRRGERRNLRPYYAKEIRRILKQWGELDGGSNV